MKIANAARSCAYSICVLMPLLATNASAESVWLTRLAATDIEVFDPHAADVEQRFLAFLHSVPMANGRRLPERLIADTSGRLRLHRRFSDPDTPAYFVGTYIDKIIAPLDPHVSEKIARRYGEPLFPQEVCPVFATHTEAGVDEMLSLASGLPKTVFANAPGESIRFHELFLLTEASHCGFLSRAVANPELIDGVTSTAELIRVIEAIGDIEAIDAFRFLYGQSAGADEGDVLFAARVLAMFLKDRTDVYSTIPAFALSLERHELSAAAGDVGSMRSWNREARRLFRQLTSHDRASAVDSKRLGDYARAVESGLLLMETPDKTRPSLKLLEQFVAAADLVSGTTRVTTIDRGPITASLTLPGAHDEPGLDTRLATDATQRH